MIIKDRRGPRDKRHHRLRRWVRGTAARPRLAVFRSLNHTYAQLVDDDTGHTLVAADSRSKEFRTGQPRGGNVAAAKAVGELLAQRAKAAGVQLVVFDRGGYKYHGRVKARAGGLVF
jgi:large subunit ribosomal protein L18